MDKKGKQLFEQCVSEIEYKSKEELIIYGQKRQIELSGMEIYPDSPLARSRKNGLDVLPLLSHSWIYSIMDLGLIEAFAKNDMKYLHDALFTYNRLNFTYDRSMASGKDDYNEYVICNNIIEAFAACDIESIKKHCPKDSPVLTKGNKMCFIGYNLILGLLYKDESRIAKGIRQAEKALATKLPKFDAAVIAYLLALVKLDAKQADEQFSVMMSLYRRSWLFEFQDPFLKVFALLPHGLYNMACYFLPTEDFEKIVPPQGTAFWNQLAEYQRVIGFIHGEPYIMFNDNLAYLKSVYANKNEN